MSIVIIHYFTGTGITAHSVKLISKQLLSAGHKVKIMQVKKDVLPPNEVFDYHIIAFPVLYWSAPVMMKRYLRKMPQGNGVKKAIIVYLPGWSWPNQITLVSAEVLLIIAAIYIVLCVAPIDAFLNLLARIPAIRRFFSISHTQKYRRYMAPGFKPLEN